MQTGWPADEPYAPRTCLGAVRALCAPDLDGEPGLELLVEIQHRILLEIPSSTGGARYATCSSREWAWDETVIVALSPPTPARADWAWRGVVGHSVRTAGEGGTVLQFRRFVRLPDGRSGIAARAFTPGFSDEAETVWVYHPERTQWRTAISRPSSAGTR